MIHFPNYRIVQMFTFFLRVIVSEVIIRGDKGG